MKNKLDNILLSILWLSAATLVTCFWFNIKFGFNIFSGAHWRHLAYMQATQTPVNTIFYISIITFIIVAISGLYLLLRPRHRKIILPIHDTANHSNKPVKQSTEKNKEITALSARHPTPTTQPITHKIPETGLSRPPRLNLGASLLNQTESFATSPTSAPAPSQKNLLAHPITGSSEINEIFESAGYTLKKTPKIGSLQTSLIAIGTNETLWIGAVGVETSALQTAIDSVQQIFSDTLDDIEINVHGFIVSARDSSAPSAPNILIFDNTDTLRNYISKHPNTPPSADDIENFEAFSSYISTVIEYLGKM